jgi:polyisoprenoid-binding protein YceI
MRKIAATVLAIVSAAPAVARPGNFTAYTMDGKQSKLEIHVYREGFLKAFGHDHLISATELSGQMHLAQPNLAESSVTFVVKTPSLVVVDPGETEKDRNEVQATMLGDKVLDATRYPQIQFISSRVRSVTQKEGVTELQVDGTLRLHGVEKPVTVSRPTAHGGRKFDRRRRIVTIAMQLWNRSDQSWGKCRSRERQIENFLSHSRGRKCNSSKLVGKKLCDRSRRDSETSSRQAHLIVCTHCYGQSPA